MNNCKRINYCLHLWRIKASTKAENLIIICFLFFSWGISSGDTTRVCWRLYIRESDQITLRLSRPSASYDWCRNVRKIYLHHFMSHKSTFGKYDNLACLQIPALSGKNVRWTKKEKCKWHVCSGIFPPWKSRKSPIDRFRRASAKAKPQNIVANKNREWNQRGQAAPHPMTKII